jgi:hypothetical protein
MCVSIWPANCSFAPQTTISTRLTRRRIVSAILHNPDPGVGPRFDHHHHQTLGFRSYLPYVFNPLRSSCSILVKQRLRNAPFNTLSTTPVSTLYAGSAMVSHTHPSNTHAYDFNESLRPGYSQPPSNTTLRNDLDSIYSKYSTHSLTPTPSYESTDRTPYKQPQSGYAESENGSTHTTDRYSDNIPLRPSKQTPLRTNWRAEGTEYPPSAESPQNQGIGLSPSPPPPTKKGWLSGKVSWVVYIVTAVQIGVFIGEIVKNCTSPPLRAQKTDITN